MYFVKNKLDYDKILIIKLGFCNDEKRLIWSIASGTGCIYIFSFPSTIFHICCFTFLSLSLLQTQTNAFVSLSHLLQWPTSSLMIRSPSSRKPSASSIRMAMVSFLIFLFHSLRSSYSYFLFFLHVSCLFLLPFCFLLFFNVYS